ncbi:sensor domain-containing diguanylate cyclase [Vibrio brasiliensis]
MKSTKWFGDRKTSSPLASLVSSLLLLSGGIVLASTIYFLSVINTQAEEDVLKRVELAITLEHSHREHIVSEYTYWDEAYTKIIVEKDADWIEVNTGKYLADAYEYDFTIGVREGDKKAFYFIADDMAQLSFDDVYSSSLRFMKELSSKSNKETKTASSFFMLGEDLYLVTGAPLIDETLSEPREGTYIAAGKHVDADYLKALAESYHLPSLTLVNSTTRAAGMNIFSLQDATGATIANLAWKHQNASHQVFPTLLLLVSVVIGVSVYIVRRIILEDSVARNSYERKLYIAATTDPLTKVSNRRHFFEVGERLLQNEAQPLAVVLIDIDHFKKINDQYGHHVGDAALFSFAEICCREIRASDVIGRIGGEEFAVILPSVTPEKAHVITERIRNCVAECYFDAEGVKLSMTISIGVVFSKQEHHLESLIKEADSALYQAKSSGRNRVVMSGIAGEAIRSKSSNDIRIYSVS